MCLNFGCIPQHQALTITNHSQMKLTHTQACGKIFTKRKIHQRGKGSRLVTSFFLSFFFSLLGWLVLFFFANKLHVLSSSEIHTQGMNVTVNYLALRFQWEKHCEYAQYGHEKVKQ